MKTREPNKKQLQKLGRKTRHTQRDRDRQLEKKKKLKQENRTRKKLFLDLFFSRPGNTRLNYKPTPEKGANSCQSEREDRKKTKYIKQINKQHTYPNRTANQQKTQTIRI